MILADEQLAELRRRYAIPEPPAGCPVCGARLQETGPGSGVWACSSSSASPREHPLLGRAGHAAYLHYQQSRWERPFRADPLVIALLDEVELRRSGFEPRAEEE